MVPLAPLPRPDPDPRAPLRPVPGRRGAAGRLPGGDRRRLDLPPRRRGPHRRGERRAPARAVRRRQGLLHRRQGRPRHRLLDHRERRRRLQLPLRPPDHAGRGAPRRGRRHRPARRPRGGLAAGAGQGRGHRQRRPGAARLRAQLAAADAVEPPRPRPRPLAGQPGAARGAAELRRPRLRLHRRHPAPADRGAGRLPQLAAHLLRHARGRARAGERHPLAHHHGAGAAARARLLPPVAADPGGEPAHPARVRGAAGAEPPPLGRDRRPQAGGEGPEGSRAEPGAGVQARRPRPDVGRGQPRAQPAARGDEDLPRRRAAAAHPPPARGGALLLPAHRRPHRPHGRHHPPAQVLRAQGRRRHRAGRPARQRARRRCR